MCKLLQGENHKSFQMPLNYHRSLWTPPQNTVCSITKASCQVNQSLCPSALSFTLNIRLLEAFKCFLLKMELLSWRSANISQAKIFVLLLEVMKKFQKVVLSVFLRDYLMKCSSVSHAFNCQEHQQSLGWIVVM